VNGSAVAGSDYTAASGTLTFGPSETTKTVSVVTIDDTASEGAETLRVDLSSPSGGATLNSQAWQGPGTINASDSNTPPAAVTDTVSVGRCTAASFNVVANDTDADGDYPLSVIGGYGQSFQTGSAYVAGSTSIGWNPTRFPGTYSNWYTVRDSRGATATGSFNITVTSSGPTSC